MTSHCPGCGLKSLQIRVDLSPTEHSEIQRQLRSEFGPFVVDSIKAEELKETLALADKDLEDCDSEVARLYGQILAVKAEKQRLEKQRDNTRALLSPIRKLPNETLLAILHYVCQQNPNIIISPIVTRLKLPTMAIISVCSHWRELGLLSPSLWANLAVDIDTRSRNMTVSTDTISRYLERSGNRPLTLTLIVKGPGSRRGIPSLIPLTQHAHRWETFIYRGERSLTDYNILSQLRFPLLAELDVDRGVTSRDWDLFGHCPTLRVLGTPSWPAGPIPKVFRNQLDHLNFRGKSLTDLREALRTWPSLKTLNMGYIDNTDADLKDSTLGTWNNITSYSFVDGLSSEIVFSSFNFPSLNKLVVYGSYTIWTLDAFPSFISRSSCMITTLTLYRIINMPDLDLIALLQVLPTLLHLEVQQSDLPHSQGPITSRLISSLTHRPTSNSLVPKLRSLYLESSSSTDAFHHSAFIRMIRSRWFKPGSNLSVRMSALGRASIRSVVLKLTSRELDSRSYKPLHILDAEGLSVVVVGKNGVQV